MFYTQSVVRSPVLYCYHGYSHQSWGCSKMQVYFEGMRLDISWCKLNRVLIFKNGRLCIKSNIQSLFLPLKPAVGATWRLKHAKNIAIEFLCSVRTNIQSQSRIEIKSVHRKGLKSAQFSNRNGYRVTKGNRPWNCDIQSIILTSLISPDSSLHCCPKRATIMWR